MINAILANEFIFIAVIIVVIFVLILLLNRKKKQKQINNVCDILISKEYKINHINLNKKEILAKKDSESIAIKLINGGYNKGIVITNKDTYFMRLYKNANSSHIDSWKLDDVKTFINGNINNKRIIIVLGGYARITKYINENELEAVTISNDAFGTKVLSLEDFILYIKGE